MGIALVGLVQEWDDGDVSYVTGYNGNVVARTGGNTMRMTPILVCGLAVGCSDAKMSMDAFDEAMMSAAESDTAFAPDEGAEFSETPAYWKLSGTLLVNEGSIQTDLSFLRVTIVGDEGGDLCTDNVGISASSRQSESPEAGVQAWWEVTRTEPAATSCLSMEYSLPVPKPVFLGLGAMHPEIEAVLAGEPDHTQSEGSRLRSVYLAMSEESTVWVFGYAETTSEEEIELDPVTGGSSVDGNWKFDALYSLPFND